MRNTLLLLLLLAVLLASYLLFFSKGRSSLNIDETHFAVEDTAIIHKFRLVRMVDGQSKAELILEKNEDQNWMVNGEYPAFQPRINQLLALLMHLKVKETLIDQGLNTAKKLLARRHTRVEISSQSDIIKTIEVGTATKDYKGTLMRLYGADTPYIVERPGLQGFLNSYFSLEEENWRSNLLFDAYLKQIQAISFENLTDTTRSWRIYRTDSEASWQWMGGHSKPDLEEIRNYLDLFQGPVYAESFAAKRFPDAFDQLKHRPVDMKFSVDYFAKPSIRILLFRREDNPNNYFGWIEGKDELLTIQTFVIDKFLSIQPFDPTSSP